MSFEERVLTMRATMPPEVFRAIRVQRSFPDKYTGHLIYLRKMSKGYDYHNGDALDESILDSLKGYFDQADVVVSQLLLLNEQLDHCKHVTAGGTTRDLVFRFYSQDELDSLIAKAEEGGVKSYGAALRMTFWLPEDDARVAAIPGEFFAAVQTNDLQQLMRSLERVV
jgi:hypothetical protein